MIINGYWGDVSPDDKFIIDSCGHIFTFKGREINRPKGRPNYLLLYIYHGEAKFLFNNREVICSSGDFVLYAPNEPQHHIYESNLSGEFYYMHFTADELPEMLHMKTSVPYHSVPSSEICDIFEEILSELQQKNDYYKTICAALSAQLFIKIHRRISNNNLYKYPSEITAVIQHINKHYNLNTSLEEYAKMCGQSKYHFIRQFKEITHVSPLKYRSQIRIDHAKNILTDSTMSIKKIAERLGYSSAEYFSEAFKNAAGMSPSDYRKKQ